MLGVDAHHVDEVIHHRRQVAAGVQQEGHVVGMGNVDEALLPGEDVAPQHRRRDHGSGGVPHVVAHEIGQEPADVE